MAPSGKLPLGTKGAAGNPENVEALEKAGVQVVERVPCLADVVDTRLAYLRTKRKKMEHPLEFDDM
jgi:GTP cyclohydrolase II